MADITVTYNQAKRTGDISINKEGNHFRVQSPFGFFNNDILVNKLGGGVCTRVKPWSEVPADIQGALAKIDAYMQTAINEDAGL